MARIGIQLPPGVKSDDTSYSTQGSYRYADHVRFDKDRAEVVKGFERVSAEYLPGVCRDILPWKDNIGASMIALSTNSHLFVWRSGGLYDITPPDYTAGLVNTGAAPGYGLGAYGKGPFGQYTGIGDYSTKTWALSNLGQALVASPRLGPIYLWLNDVETPAVKLSDLDNANQVPELCNYSLVTKDRQILALGCNEQLSGDFNPLCIRGSDIDGVVWEWGVDLTNNAFEYILPSGGTIVAGRVWGENIGVWTQGGLFYGQFTGDPSATYRFDPASGGVGLLGPNAVTIVGNVAYWISPDLQVVACPYGGSPEVIECPIIDTTLATMSRSQGDKVVVSYIGSAGEIRIDYPDSREGGLENSRYITLHLKTGAWSQGVERRTAFNRGNPLQYPLAAQSFNRLLPTIAQITDFGTAQTALLAAQLALPAYAGDNRAMRQNAVGDAQAAVQEITSGISGWGFALTGDGSLPAQGDIHNLNIQPNLPISISYVAQVVIGPDVTGHVKVYHTPDEYTDISDQIVTYNSTAQVFRHENIMLPVNSTNPTVSFFFEGGAITSGTLVQITDIKIEQGESSTLWTPSKDDPDLFTEYAPFIRSLEYNQNVSEFYYQELGENADGSPMKWSIETNDFSMDENRTSYMIKGFIPDFIGQRGTVYLTVYLRDNPQDETERVMGPYAIQPGQDRVDFRGTCKLARFKLEGNSSPASLRMGRPMFDAVPTGTR